MDTKYTNSLEDNVAIMLLNGEIGGPDFDTAGPFVSASDFVREMQFHKSRGRHIVVHINSPGGKVFGGFSLIQAIMDFDADTHIVGLAASMAGIVAQFGKKRTANDFAVGMIHMPKGSKNSDLLDLIAKNLAKILTSRSNISPDAIEDIMKQETFFDADQMLAHGLIDEIITTNVTAPNDVKAHSVSDLYNIYNHIIIDTEMKKLKAHFNLTGEVTEDEILNNIINNVTSLKTEITDKDAELSVKDTEVSRVQTELEAMRATNIELTNTIAESIVDAAIEAGKVDKTKKDIWLDAAKKDPKAVKAQLDSLKAVGNISVQTAIVNSGESKIAKKPEDDVVDFIRNRGAEFLEIQKSDPDRAEAIMNSYQLIAETSKIKN